MISEIEAEDLVLAALRTAATNEHGVLTLTIESVPEEPSANAYRVRGEKGCILVQHAQIVYSDPTPSVRAPRWRQLVTMDISCQVGDKSARKIEGHRGALEILALARNTLSGLALGVTNDTPVVLYPIRQQYIRVQDKIYWYRIVFRAQDVFERTNGAETT